MEEDFDNEILAEMSVNEVERFVDGPIWQWMVKSVEQAMEYNKRDILTGDISQRAQGEPGLIYRSDEALRGGIIGMGLIKELPAMLIEAIQEAQEEKQEKNDE